MAVSLFEDTTAEECRKRTAIVLDLERMRLETRRTREERTDREASTTEEMDALYET